MASPTPASIPLTLIVAATPQMGIGFKRALPWPPLKFEMAYFARVTRRAPPRCVNAVIMGRRTWESIPHKFRPLRRRVNVIISRNPDGLGFESGPPGATRLGGEQSDEIMESPFAAESITSALKELCYRYRIESTSSRSVGQKRNCGDVDSSLALHRVFIIGGAELYASALEMPATVRVLLTRIKNTFECDTFFPLELDGITSASEKERDNEIRLRSNDWQKAFKHDLDDWTGEAVPDGIQKQDDIEWQFEMWEREMRLS